MKRLKKKKRQGSTFNKGSSTFFPKIQKKIAIGKPNDKYEVEADSVADKVVNTSEPNSTIQKKGEGDEKIQQRPLVSTISPLVQRMESSEEETVQAKTVAIQKMEEEEAVQTKEDEETVQAKEEDESIQKSEEEEVQAKLNTKKVSTTPTVENNLKGSKGQGSKMNKKTKTTMESGFGADFNHVTIHTDSNAIQMSKELGAHAFTYGNDIYFNKGKYNPSTKKGKHLLAHELTHTIQQKGSKTNNVQRKGSSWRYHVQKIVARSVAEIQAIVGATPDGVYGPKTREAVVKYQKILKAKNLYADTIDGKWGKNTEAGHMLFAYAPNAHRRGYNCAGLAFKWFRWVNLPETKKEYNKMTKLKTTNDICNAFDFKFWLWEMDVQVKNNITGVISKKHPDFHTVSGRTHKDGRDPKMVMSKNGKRPLEGPGSPLSFEVKSGPAQDNNGIPSAKFNWVLTNVKLTSYCSKNLP